MTQNTTLPPLPKQVMLPAGPYKVVRADVDAENGETIWGECDYESRTITVKPRISRNVAWLALEHEIVHAILFDAGVKLSEVKEECVADAIATYRVYERNHHE